VKIIRGLVIRGCNNVVRGRLKSLVYSRGDSRENRAIKTELMIREVVRVKWNYLVISDGYYG